MWPFDLLGEKQRLAVTIQDCTAGMAPQFDTARQAFSSRYEFEKCLGSKSTVLFLFGFVLFFAGKHGIKSQELIWAVTVKSFANVLGDRLSGSAISGLQQALRNEEEGQWIDEGVNAAKFYENERLPLLAYFLEGMAEPYTQCAHEGGKYPDSATTTKPPDPSVGHLKVVIKCPNCGQKMRAPSGMHLDINCPACGGGFRMFT